MLLSDNKEPSSVSTTLAADTLMIPIEKGVGRGLVLPPLHSNVAGGDTVSSAGNGGSGLESPMNNFEQLVVSEGSTGGPKVRKNVSLEDIHVVDYNDEDEEDEEVADDDDNENDEDDGTVIFNPATAFDDGIGQWIPIHLLARKKSFCWTHFFGLNQSLSELKCKHCGLIIGGKDDISLIKRAKNHLKNVHEIAPETNYYDEKRRATNRVSKHKLVRPGLRIKSPSRANSQDTENRNRSNSVAESKVADEHETLRQSKEREISFPTNQLLSIIIASENLPLSFVDNTAVRLLISRVPKSYHVDQRSIKDSIIRTSNQIDELVRRTVQRNNADLPLIIDTSYLSNTSNERNAQLIQRLRLQLIEMGKTTFFSLSHFVWDEKFALLSLQFYDNFNGCTKTIPLLLSTLESETISVTIRSQLSKVFANIPGLHKSVLSITLPRPRLIRMLHLDDHDFFSTQRNPKNFYHNCIISIISNAILPLFGHLDETSTKNKKKEGCTKIISPLDSLVNLSNVNLSSSVFDRINSFYEELCTDPWQLDRFHSLCETHLKNRDLRVITFDPNIYSTAEKSLKRFLKLRSVVEAIDPHIRNERFTEVDFQIMTYMLNTLESIDKLLLFFASSTSLNFTYVLMSILSIEKHLSSTLSTLQFQRLVKPFEAVLKNVQEFKKILISDDMNLLAMFLCPAALFEREILEYIFKTVSLSEIVDMISQTVLDLLRKFLDVHTVDSSQQSQARSDDDEERHLQPEKRNENQSDFIGFSFSNLRDLRLLNGDDNSFSNNVETLLLHCIQEDLYDYLTNVNSVVPIAYRSFCEKNGFVRYNGHFKRKSSSIALSNQDENGQTLNFIEELTDIHIPVCNSFWDQFLQNGAGPVIKILIKMMRTQSASSVRSEFSFLKDFVPHSGEDIIEKTVKIKLFNSQFVAGKVDFDMDTLPMACQYTSQ